MAHGASAATLLLSFNADDLVPGREPPFQRNWGNEKDDIWRVDNLETYNGSGNAFLFDRQAEGDPGSWGAGFQIPSYKADWIVLQLAFKFEGPATAAKASMEVRNSSSNRLYYANLGSTKGKDPVTLINADNTWKSEVVNHFDRKKWNRVTWYIPTALGETQKMLLQLETYDRETESWIQVGKGEGLEIEVTSLPKIFRINFPSDPQPIQLYFDDLTVSSLSNQEMDILRQSIEMVQ